MDRLEKMGHVTSSQRDGRPGCLHNVSQLSKLTTLNSSTLYKSIDDCEIAGDFLYIAMFGRVN